MKRVRFFVSLLLFPLWAPVWFVWASFSLVFVGGATLLDHLADEYGDKWFLGWWS